MARADPWPERAAALDESVRLYSSDDVRLPKRLAALLQQRIDGLSAEVLHGQMSRGEYRFSTGQILGLRQALEFCEEIAKELGG
jgi:hypothetical protein